MMPHNTDQMLMSGFVVYFAAAAILFIVMGYRDNDPKKKR
jgi:hypothetical protein